MILVCCNYLIIRQIFRRIKCVLVCRKLNHAPFFLLKISTHTFVSITRCDGGRVPWLARGRGLRSTLGCCVWLILLRKGWQNISWREIHSIPFVAINATHIHTHGLVIFPLYPLAAGWVTFTVWEERKLEDCTTYFTDRRLRERIHHFVSKREFKTN